MAWLKIDQTLRDNRKICNAAEDLKIEPAHMAGMMVLFWLWAIDNAPSGSLAELTDGTIARGAMYGGDPKTFIEVLVKRGLLNENEEGLQIHDWEEYAGNLLDKRRKDARRKAVERASKKAEMSAGRPQDVQRTSAPKSKSKSKSKSNISPPSPSEEGGEKEKDVIEIRFAEFWSAYPKKASKQYALKAWKKLQPDAELHEKIMQAVNAQKQSKQWHRDNGQYIPYPATWLNGGQWDNELEEATTGLAGSADKDMELLRKAQKRVGL